jgi:serine/threonine-protein kinase RsbW
MNKQAEIYKLTLANKVSELERIKSVIDKLIQNWNIPLKTGLSINLALEEAFTNIVNYAFTDNEAHSIEIVFVKNAGQLIITLSDDGIEYDPTQNKNPQIDLPVQDRQVGGLGIYLIRKLMDKVEYMRESGKNYLTLTKIL